MSIPFDAAPLADRRWRLAADRPVEIAAKWAQRQRGRFDRSPRRWPCRGAPPAASAASSAARLRAGRSDRAARSISWTSSARDGPHAGPPPAPCCRGPQPGKLRLALLERRRVRASSLTVCWCDSIRSRSSLARTATVRVSSDRDELPGADHRDSFDHLGGHHHARLELFARQLADDLALADRRFGGPMRSTRARLVVTSPSRMTLLNGTGRWTTTCSCQVPGGGGDGDLLAVPVVADDDV